MNKMGIFDDINDFVNGLGKKNPGSHGSHVPGSAGGVDFRVASMTGSPGAPEPVSGRSARAEHEAQQAEVRAFSAARIARDAARAAKPGKIFGT